MQYNISFDIAALLLSVITFTGVRLTKDMHRLENVIFSVIIAVDFLTACADIASAYCLTHTGQIDYAITETAAYLYLIIHNMLPFLYYLYVLLSSGGTLKFLLRFGGIQLLPLLGNILVVVTQPFFHHIFVIGNDGTYYRQPFMGVLYLTAAIYIMLGSWYAIAYNRRLTGWRVPMFLGYTAATGVAIILQVLWPGQLIEVFCQSLAFVALMYTIEDSESIYDAVEKLYNRKGFLIDMEKHFAGREPFGLVVVRFTNIRRYVSLIGASRLHSFYVNHLKELVKGFSRSKWYDLGNNTFVFDNEQRKTAWMDSFRKRLETKFQRSWSYEGLELFPEAQIFAVRIPEDFDHTDQILKIADSFHFNLPVNKVLSGEMLSGIKKEMLLEDALRKALAQDGFEVFYQPVYEAASGRIRSAEALVRLKDENLGLISPEDFIPIAEKNGMIVEIGMVVLRKVCRFMKAHALSDLGLQFFDINLSIIQCMQGDFSENVAAVLAETEVPANAFNFEITQAISWENNPGIQHTIEALHAIGSGFSLDNFGTGYSNLSAVSQMEFDMIKIDKSLLWDADESKNAGILLGEVIHTLREMNRKVVVKGVETEAQKQKLLDFGCDYLQGFYFSRPLEEETFIRYVREFQEGK